ncbi:MAG: replicative DNA helicase [Lachnospiraceae bacterium]|nr:replicative DNA helicase [Lachnospiraceae bacterium]
MEENTIRRILPHNEDAEISVVGSMLIDPETINLAAEMLTGNDFYNRSYGIIFDTMVELYTAGKSVDPVILQNSLREKNAPPETSSTETISNIINTVPTSANIKGYASIVSEKAMLRKIIKANEAIAERCYKDQEDLNLILNDTEKSIFDLVQRRNTEDLTPIRQVVNNALESIEQAYKNKGIVTGVATGFIDLDYKTSGLHPSELILIAARPAMGKTAFVLNLAQHMALKQNKVVAMFSLEMSKEQLINRMFSLQSTVDAQNIRTGRLSLDDWNRLTRSATEIGMSKLVIDDTPGVTVNEMRSKLRKVKLQMGLDIVIIDYLQLMSGSGRAESRQNEISEISRSLKVMARELEVPVIALSQLSRAVEQRTDHRPMLSDLRESGAIEQDADVVMFIYRDDYYNKDTPKQGVSEIIIAKQRSGPIGTIELAWIPELTKFANLEHNHKNEE